jgi:hypothetical protein
MAENKILKDIKLREGEEDIRDLSAKDYRQLEYRLMADFWQYLNALNQTMVLQQIILMEMAKKQGIDIDKILNNLQVGQTNESNT